MTQYYKINSEKRSVVCDIEDCMFSRECAQHNSAGMYRDESGITPPLKLLNDYVCCTKQPDVEREDGMLVLNSDNQFSLYRDNMYEN